MSFHFIWCGIFFISIDYILFYFTSFHLFYVTLWQRLQRIMVAAGPEHTVHFLHPISASSASASCEYIRD
jgi:hypothetical protein